MKRALLILFCVFLVQQFTMADTQEKRQYNAKNINPHPPVIDGKLDDPVWQSGEWGDGFTQREPYEGKAPTQRTSFKIPDGMTWKGIGSRSSLTAILTTGQRLPLLSARPELNVMFSSLMTGITRTLTGIQSGR